MRRRADDERKMIEKAKKDSMEPNLSPKSAEKRSAGQGPAGQNIVKSDESRNWFQKQKDKLVGTKEERQKAKEERHRIQAEERKKARVSHLPPMVM